MVGLMGLYRSQGFHAPGPSGRFISSFACTSNRPASGRGAVFLVLSQQRPDDARILVGDGDDGAVRPSAFPQIVHPPTELVRFSGRGSHDCTSTMD